MFWCGFFRLILGVSDGRGWCGEGGVVEIWGWETVAGITGVICGLRFCLFFGTSDISS